MIRSFVLSTLAAGLFYGLYCLTLRRDRWLATSQWYLLTTLWFSIMIPWFSIPSKLATVVQTVFPTEGYMATLDEISISANASPRAIDLADIYFVGMPLCLGFLLFQLTAQAVTVIRLRRRHTVYRSDDGFDIPHNASLLLLDDDTAPYSFFRQIVIGTRGLTDDELQCVLAHESLHVSRYHTADIICARLLCCAAWFNPFAWLMLRELRAVHEYQADAAALSSSSPKLGEVDAEGGRRSVYLQLLFKQSTGIGYGHITNNFQSINLKKRITMMKQQKSRFGAWKALAALPVAALLLVVGCQPNPEETSTPATELAQPATADTDILDVAEVSPEFPGGVEALYKYLAENIHYPEQAKADKVEGRVFVRFVVEKDGSVGSAEVLRGIGGGCDEEAVRVVNAMPRWTPGMQSGVPVRVQFNLPITFKLQ